MSKTTQELIDLLSKPEFPKDLMDAINYLFEHASRSGRSSLVDVLYTKNTLCREKPVMPSRHFQNERFVKQSVHLKHGDRYTNCVFEDVKFIQDDPQNDCVRIENCTIKDGSGIAVATASLPAERAMNQVKNAAQATFPSGKSIVFDYADSTGFYLNGQKVADAAGLSATHRPSITFAESPKEETWRDRPPLL